VAATLVLGVLAVLGVALGRSGGSDHPRVSITVGEGVPATLPCLAIIGPQPYPVDPCVAVGALEKDLGFHVFLPSAVPDGWSFAQVGPASQTQDGSGNLHFDSAQVKFVRKAAPGSPSDWDYVTITERSATTPAPPCAGMAVHLADSTSACLMRHVTTVGGADKDLVSGTFLRDGLEYDVASRGLSADAVVALLNSLR
jgi:hypothetical protein